MVNIGIIKEIRDTRVSATPQTVKSLIALGLDVLVEEGAGEESSFPDTSYKEAGAKIAPPKEVYAESDIILTVNSPTMHPEFKKNQLDLLKDKAIWVSFLIPDAEIFSIRESKQLTLFSMNQIPRISRAQKMDALTSQSNIAGYKAVILAAQHLPKLFPLMMTASGTIQPAKVVILGVGVAGLQAIATAKRLGAKVEASDIRLSTKEQVESLGAEFIQVPTEENMEDEQGYAKEASADYLKKQAEEVARRIAKADVVISTALVPGKKAPVLITEDMVKSMQPGSVIVDMAAIQGGNCSLTDPGVNIVKEGVMIIGDTNIAGSVAQNASEMYAKNLFYFVEGMIKENAIAIDKEDEIYQAAEVRP